MIDTFSGWSGKAVAWTMVPFFLGLTYEVISRYLFNALTGWAVDASRISWASR